MKRLLLPLLAALALPTAVNAEEFIELKPINQHSYKKSSLVKWGSAEKKYFGFIGTTQYPSFVHHVIGFRDIKRSRKRTFWDNRLQPLSWEYEIDCQNYTFNRLDDKVDWMDWRADPTALTMGLKYCKFDEWSKLPNK